MGEQQTMNLEQQNHRIRTDNSQSNQEGRGEL